jgi:hypothetical protein
MLKPLLHGYITLGILLVLLLISGLWYSPFHGIEKIQASLPGSGESVRGQQPLYEDKYVVVNLGTMEVSLKQGTTSLATLPIISIGKPGSYYETIGGAYGNDYKIKNHFSSIGHVYMPWSVHVYGNFFIHGIPYYPNGEKVSSTYSGGCIRLSDEDAKQVYDFIAEGTPIVVTEHDEYEFVPTAQQAPSIESLEMTRLMVATVSLEVLAQDNEITDIDGKGMTTRRKLLPRLLIDGDDRVSEKLSASLGADTFIMYMNKKAVSLGLTNTTFTSLDSPVLTTAEDRERFMHYITEYKTYLVTLIENAQ